MKIKNYFKKGFTLLEMLVVMGIIMILIGMMTASYSTAQKKARDSRKMSDLKAIQNAMEQYYSICGFVYPTGASSVLTTSINCPTPAVSIMPTVPVDPRTTPYQHNPRTATEYRICTFSNLETKAEKACVSNLQ